MSTTAKPSPHKQVDRPLRVLFICIGNACRSQMAEAFARAYGSDVITAVSAGLMPAMSVPADTVRAMEEKNIEIRRHFPKSWRHLGAFDYDLVVNLSGCELPAEIDAPTRVWNVPDPYLSEYTNHCKVRDRIEHLVMNLILEVRRTRKRESAR